MTQLSEPVTMAEMREIVLYHESVTLGLRRNIDHLEGKYRALQQENKDLRAQLERLA